MSAIQRKLAALRQKRARPNSSHLLLPANLPLSPSSDVSSSDEEDDALVVLPPPKGSMSAVRQRREWMKAERERARRKTVGILRESYPEGFGQMCDVEVKKEENEPKEEEEVTEEDGEEEGQEEVEEWRDEEEEALESAEKRERETEKEDVEQGNDIEEEDCQNELGNPGEEAEENEEEKESIVEKQTIHTDTEKEGDNAQTDEHVEDESEKAQEPTVSDTQDKGVTLQEEHQEVVLRKVQIEDSGACGLIEDEADEERGVGTVTQGNGGEDENMVEEEEDEGVECEVSEKEKKKLALFHRKWLMEKDNEGIGEKKEADEDEDEKLGTGEPVVAREVSVGEEKMEDEGAWEEAKRKRNYVEAMFVRDDSRSAMHVMESGSLAAEEEEEDGTGRDKARALWKARQKFKLSLIKEDENSLSRFDIFGDREKTRGSMIRAKLEGACRGATQGSVKERSKRIESNAKKGRGGFGTSSLEGKKRKAVAIGSWSYGDVGVKERTRRKSGGGVSYQPRKKKREGERWTSGGPKTSARCAVRNAGRRGGVALLGVLGRQAKQDRNV